MRKENIHFFALSLIAINVTIIVAAEFLRPLWSSYAQYIGGDVRTAGIAVSTFSIVIGLCIVFAGYMEHRLKNEENMMIVTSALLSIIYLGYFFVHHAWQLYILQALLGITCAFQSPAIFSLYHRYIPKEKSALYWGIWNGFYFIAIGTASLISAFALHHFGFKMVFAILWLFSLASFLLCLFLMPQMKQQQHQERIVKFFN
ncbi:MAG: MFS transporter [Pseudomonadota bacterium]|mgnify:CR=1 FL=1